MRLPIFDMPDEPVPLRTWLEQQLAGLELRDLVSQLAVVHGTPPERLTLENACGSTLPEILTSGLSHVGSDVIQKLLTHPALLLELQDRITFDGGEFWLNVPISTEHQAAVDRGWQRLQADLSPESVAESRRTETKSEAEIKTTTPANDSLTGPTDVWGRAAARPRRSSLRTVLVICGLLVAVGVGILLQPSPTGWANPGRLTAGQSPSQVFGTLAGATVSYIDAPRQTPQQLQVEIELFIHDCQQVQKLSLPELAALPHPDRELQGSTLDTYADWLNVKCKAWEGKAAQVLASLRDGTLDRDTADEQYTEIIRKLKTALEKQAAALA